MPRPGARARAVLACAAAVSALVTLRDPAGAASGSAAGSDTDSVTISGSDAEFDGSLTWSNNRARPAMSAKLSGRLSALRGGCARVQVDWLNAGTGSLASARSACTDSGSVVLRFRHASLECARVRVLVADEQTGPTRLVCAGGS